MAYYLVSGSNKSDYLVLSIRASSSFIPVKNYKHPGACSLEEIDLFTSMFNNQAELKKTLFDEGILPAERLGKSLSIRNSYNGEYKRVSYGLIFNDSIEYIHDLDLINKEIYRRYLNRDYKFLQALGNTFLKDYKAGRFAADVRGAANISMQTGEHYSKLFDEPFYYMMEGDNALSYSEIVSGYRHTDLVKGFLMSLMYESYSRTILDERYGEIEVIIFKKKKKYNNAHALLAFMNDYDASLKKEMSPVKKETVPAYEEKFKKRVRKNVDPNQLSFFDILEMEKKK